MKNTFTLRIVTLAIGVLLLATTALAGSDTFNRQQLGPTWVVTSGSLSISNFELVGTSLSLGYQALSSNDTAAVSAVVFLGGNDLEYGAVALGNIGGGTNAFVKIQAQNGAGTFDHAAFYTGNNSGTDFFTLSSPVPSPAILDVFFCGTTATMRITSAGGVQTYSHDYGASFGLGGGLGTFGSVRLDNYIGYINDCGCNNAQLEEAVPTSRMRHDKDLSLEKKRN